MNARLAPSMLAALSVLLSSCATQRAGEDAATSAALDPVLASSHCSPERRGRDVYRHPRQTLLFFGIRPDMTVVEVWPGSGWYTEILAPLLRDRGRLYAAHLAPSGSEYARISVERFPARLAERPDVFDKVTVTTLAAPPAAAELAPPESADMVVTFRNLHNWMMFGWERDALRAIHRALKPGGVLGIV